MLHNLNDFLSQDAFTHNKKILTEEDHDQHN